jgi:PHD/YefM family antitoxin component YafN of YafNO toxin-antitoxin module
MKTLDLRQESITLEQLLQVANTESVLILSENGNQYILENADAFEEEVTALGNSEKFMSFLAERATEKGSISLDEIEDKFLL